jgi:hypothetical protein
VHIGTRAPHCSNIHYIAEDDDAFALARKPLVAEQAADAEEGRD